MTQSAWSWYKDKTQTTTTNMTSRQKAIGCPEIALHHYRLLLWGKIVKCIYWKKDSFSINLVCAFGFCAFLFFSSSLISHSVTFTFLFLLFNFYLCDIEN